MKKSLYLETTIPSYMAGRISSNITIAGRQAITHDFWEDERSKYDLFISDYVIEECEKGNPIVAKKRLEILNGIDILDTTPDVEPLADVYMRILSIPKSKRLDALHLAICCVHGIDILLTWNCTHLGNEEVKRLAQRHNDAHGMPTPWMATPDFLVGKYMEVDFNE
jgi:predicted nucleic acid-binding protein